MSDLYERVRKQMSGATVFEAASLFCTSCSGDDGTALVSIAGDTAVLVIEGREDLVRLLESARTALAYLDDDTDTDTDADATCDVSGRCSPTNQPWCQHCAKELVRGPGAGCWFTLDWSQHRHPVCQTHDDTCKTPEP